MAREKIVIKVLNIEKEFEIETDLDPLQAYSLAAYINKKLEDVGKEQTTTDTMNLFYHTLIALGHEIFALKVKNDNIENDFNKKTDELILQIDSSLQV